MLKFSDYTDKISKAVHYHVENKIPLAENIYRIHSEEFYKLFREARELYNEGILDVISDWDKQLLASDIGEFGIYEEQEVPLDIPIEEVEVWLGKKGFVQAYVKSDIYKIIPKSRKKFLKVSLNYKGPIQAPIKKDEFLGKLKITYKDELIDEYDLLAYENVKKLNVFSRLMRSINFLIWGDV